MSEASRARRQRALNLREEAAARAEQTGADEPPGADLDPSWGPLGSLAKRMLPPEEVQKLVEWDAQIAALERQRQQRESPPPEPRGADW
jgi:hypothetical protein